MIGVSVRKVQNKLCISHPPPSAAHPSLLLHLPPTPFLILSYPFLLSFPKWNAAYMQLCNYSTLVLLNAKRLKNSPSLFSQKKQKWMWEKETYRETDSETGGRETGHSETLALTTPCSSERGHRQASLGTWGHGRTVMPIFSSECPNRWVPPLCLLACEMEFFEIEGACIRSLIRYWWSLYLMI